MLRIACIVQGEGRGHMTQALALQQIVTDAGHTLCEVLVGSSPRREIPAFFREKIGCPVTRFDSPNFVTGKDNKRVQFARSIGQSLVQLPTYLRSVRLIAERLRACRPDVVINFYEPLCGLYALLHRPAAPILCVGHQYMLEHPAYPMPPHRAADLLGLRFFNALTSLGARRKLALSYYPASQRQGRTTVVPPLLRRELFAQAPTDGEHLLVYLLNDGYAEDILAWHRAHPEIPLHCFWDRKGAPERERVDDTLTLHQLHDLKFLEKMASCRGLVTTAGFESACEALYLGKPQLMVPVEGHFEQYCNARDAASVGVGLYDDAFRLERLLAYADQYVTDPQPFRDWVGQAPTVFLREVEAAAKGAAT